MTRTKQIEKLISDVNYYLKANEITDEGNDLFLCVTHSLMTQGLYKGFNYYKRSYVETVPKNEGGTELVEIDITCKEQECQFLQIL